MTQTVPQHIQDIAAKIDISSAFPNSLQRQEMAFRKRELRNYEVVATLVRFFNYRVRALKESIAEAKPRVRQREWKTFNRALRIYLDSHEKTYIYDLDDTHKARVSELMIDMEERTERGLALLYFCVRTEILNSGCDESEVEPIVQCRICDMMLRCFAKCAQYIGGVGLNEEHARLQECMRIFAKREVDKGGHQALWVKIFTRTIIDMMKENEQ